MGGLRDVFIGSVAALGFYLTPACIGVNQYTVPVEGGGSCSITFNRDDSDLIELRDSSDRILARRYHKATNSHHDCLYEFFDSLGKISEYDPAADVLKINGSCSEVIDCLYQIRQSVYLQKKMIECESRLEKELK